MIAQVRGGAPWQGLLDFTRLDCFRDDIGDGSPATPLATPLVTPLVTPSLLNP
ncbi:MAG: hypothetical protein LBV73_31005 [Paraburkholderia sp.]|jgi:hypothetical protein|nr:hypothetical protein [Paraburkholderia sp.]